MLMRLVQPIGGRDGLAAAAAARSNSTSSLLTWTGAAKTTCPDTQPDGRLGRVTLDERVGSGVDGDGSRPAARRRLLTG